MSIESDLPAARASDIKWMEHLLDVITWEAAHKQPTRLQNIGKCIMKGLEVVGESFGHYPLTPFY